MTRLPQSDSLEALYAQTNEFIDVDQHLIHLCMHDLMYRSSTENDTRELTVYGDGLELCKELYDFCQTIFYSEDIAFRISTVDASAAKQIAPLKLAEYFSRSFFKAVKTYWDTQLCLREQHIITLMEILSKEFPLWLEYLMGDNPPLTYNDESFDNADHTLAEDFNTLITLSRQAFRQRTFKQKVSARKHKSKRRYSDSMQLIELLLEKHKLLTVIRLDLGLRRNLTLKNAKLRPSADIHACVSRLLNNKKSNSIFKNLVGYIRKYEYISELGVYEHIILLFAEDYSPSSYRKKIEQISRYWEEVITNGGAGGFCLDCSISIQPYRRSGTPCVDHGNLAALSIGIEYLAKSAMFLDYSPRNSKQKVWVTSYQNTKNDA